MSAHITISAARYPSDGTGLGEPEGAGTGERDGLGAGEPDGVGAGDDDGIGIGEPEGLGSGMGAPVGEPPGLAIGVVVPDRTGTGEVDGDGESSGTKFANEPNPNCGSGPDPTLRKPAGIGTSNAARCALVGLSQLKSPVTLPDGRPPSQVQVIRPGRPVAWSTHSTLSGSAAPAGESAGTITDTLTPCNRTVLDTLYRPQDSAALIFAGQLTGLRAGAGRATPGHRAGVGEVSPSHGGLAVCHQVLAG
jgi:hypothetical protein